MFPFTDADQTDPETGITDGLIARAFRSNTVPKLFHVLTDSEYFNRAGSLVHTDVTGMRDIPPPATRRIYFIASAPHIVGAFPPAPFQDPDFVGRADMNTLVYTPVIRALLAALDKWITDGGIRLPEIAVPLATHTGWNYRKATIGTAIALVSDGFLLAEDVPAIIQRAAAHFDWATK